MYNRCLMNPHMLHPSGSEPGHSPAEERPRIGRREMMLECIKRAEPVEIKNSADFQAQLTGLPEEVCFELFLLETFRVLKGAEGTPFFEQFRDFAGRLLAAVKSATNHGEIVETFKDLNEADILAVTQLLIAMRPANEKTPSGRVITAVIRRDVEVAVQDAPEKKPPTQRIERRAGPQLEPETPPKPIARPSTGNFSSGDLESMLAKAAEIKSESASNGSTGTDGATRLAELDVKRHERPDKLVTRIILLDNLISQFEGATHIRMGKEDIITTLKKAKAMLEQFAADPQLSAQQGFLQELARLGGDLIAAALQVFKKAQTTGAAYLTSTSRHLLAQMRAVVNQITIRSPQDIAFIQKAWGLQGKKLSEAESEALSTIGVMLMGRTVSGKGIENANALVGEMIEASDERKESEGYNEWIEIMLVFIAGDIRSNVNLSPEAFVGFVEAARECAGHLQPFDVPKIQSIEVALREIEGRHATGTDTNITTKAKEDVVTEKKSPQLLEEARGFAKCLMARLLITPATTRRPGTTFEKIFKTKLLPHIEGSYQGATLLEDGEQTEASNNFLKQTGDGLVFQAEVTKEAARELCAAFKSTAADENIAFALDDVFGAD